MAKISIFKLTYEIDVAFLSRNKRYSAEKYIKSPVSIRHVRFKKRTKGNPAKSLLHDLQPHYELDTSS